MTAYDEFRKSRCEWCAKGVQLVEDVREHVLDNGCLPIKRHGDAARPCTAPSAEQAYDELARTLSEVRAKIEAAPHGEGCNMARWQRECENSTGYSVWNPNPPACDCWKKDVVL
jgi:hypothetical protein